MFVSLMQSPIVPLSKGEESTQKRIQVPAPQSHVPGRSALEARSPAAGREPGLSSGPWVLSAGSYRLYYKGLF